MRILGVIYMLMLFACGAEQTPSTHMPTNAVVDANDSLQSEITCPHCAFKKTETMPTETCLITYTCAQCKKVLHPVDEDCCVFCSYGSKKCPSMK